MDIDAALFYNLSDDYISTEIVGDADSGISRYVNADKAKTFGSELSLNLRATENLNPYFSLSWIKRKRNGLTAPQRMPRALLNSRLVTVCAQFTRSLTANGQPTLI